VSPSRFRVTVVDDHSLFAESLAIALRARDVETCTVIPDPVQTTFAQLGRLIVKTQPHLVLLDLDLGIPGDGMRLLSGLSGGGVSVVVVTGSSDRVHLGEALAHGARAVIEKSARFADIVETVDRVRNRLPAMSRHDHDALLRSYRHAEESTRELRRRFATLTRREAEVLGALMSGKQVGEIARLRFVSESTVRTQVKSILAKLGVSSQLTAVGLAHKLGWEPRSGERPDDTPSGGRGDGSELSAAG
jgi:two-component system, NarL family, nitrate/nitrite response regulator NarL